MDQTETPDAPIALEPDPPAVDASAVAVVENTPMASNVTVGQFGQERAAEPNAAPAPTPLDPAAIARDYDPQQIENIARGEEGLPALPIRGTGRNFDQDGAWEDLHQTSLEVDANLREVEELTKKRKSAVARLEESQAYLKRLVDQYFEAKTRKDQQPDLPLQADTGCPVARDLGVLCPACASAWAKYDGVVPLDDPLYMYHPQHADVARELLIKDRDELAANLKQKNFHIHAAELATMPVGDLQQLQRYAVQTGPIPPPLLSRAHIAAEAGTHRQECTRCGLQLWGESDIVAGAPAYPALAAVGLDCPGRADEADPVAAMPLSGLQVQCVGDRHVWSGDDGPPTAGDLCRCGTALWTPRPTTDGQAPTRKARRRR